METKKPGVFERLGSRLRNGWDRLHDMVTGMPDRMKLIKTETKLEGTLIRGTAEAVVGVAGEVKKDLLSRWNDSGKNFTQRLRNTAGEAWRGIREGWGRFTGAVRERATDLRERYQREGIAGATLGIVGEALQTVGELPDRMGIRVNDFRAIVEDQKNEIAIDQRRAVKKEQRDGWKAEYDLLGLTRKRVLERRKLFETRALACRDRLEAMQAGREKFVRARSAAILRPIGATA